MYVNNIKHLEDIPHIWIINHPKDKQKFVFVVHRIDLTLVVPMFMLGNVKKYSYYPSFRNTDIEPVSGIHSHWRQNKFILHSQYPGC